HVIPIRLELVMRLRLRTIFASCSAFSSALTLCSSASYAQTALPFMIHTVPKMALRIMCPFTIGTRRSASRAKGMYRIVAVVTALSVALGGAAAAKRAAHVPLPPSNPLKNSEQEKQQQQKPAMALFSQKQLPSLGRAMAIGYYPRGCLQGGIELP